jgi:quercetin dioxygenase-like cupin family protein
MVAYDLDVALRDLPDRAMRFLAALNECTIGVSRFWGEPHWERHPGGDELLHLLEGEAEVETLTDAGPVLSTVRAGSIFICPRGLWHRVRPRSPVSLLFATPGEGTESSSAADPRGRQRAGRSAPARGRRRKAASPALEGRDIGSVLAALPELRIGSDTTAEQADGAFGEIATLNRCTMYVGRFQGDAPWERHSNGDELLHILDGETELTVLTDGGPVRRTLRAGSLFVCPRGLWHRQAAPRGVTAIYATPKPTDVSFADDPRLDA